MQPPISSRQHPLVKLCRALQNSKGRREHGLFLIEGQNAVEAALNAHWPLREVLARENETELSARAREAGIEVRRAAIEVLEAASDAQTPKSILALGELPPPIKNFDLSGLMLIIDGVSDPGNVGTLLRAADAAGVEKVILTEGSADVWSPKVVRSAAGSLFALPPLQLANRSPKSLARMLEEKQIPILSAEAHCGQSAFEFAWPRRCALALGHETRGISSEFQSVATPVTLPGARC